MLYFIITTISILYNKKQKVFIFATASALHYETINHVMFKFASPKTLLFSIFLLPFLIFGNYSYAVQEYSEEETSIEREEKDPNQPLESQIEIIEHELNEPIRGFLGEDAKIRIGMEQIRSISRSFR